MHRISFRFHHRDGLRNELQDDRLKEKKKILRKKKQVQRKKRNKKEMSFRSIYQSIRQMAKAYTRGHLYSVEM